MKKWKGLKKDSLFFDKIIMLVPLNVFAPKTLYGMKQTPITFGRATKCHS